MTPRSTNFATAGAYQTVNAGGNDAFVAKLNAAGSALVYATYLGGSGDDRGLGIAVDGSGNAYVTGVTASTNFPTLNAYQSAYGGNGDAFVTKFNASGSALLYSTYLGGSGSDDSDRQRRRHRRGRLRQYLRDRLYLFDQLPDPQCVPAHLRRRRWRCFRGEDQSLTVGHGVACLLELPRWQPGGGDEGYGIAVDGLRQRVS